MHARLPCNCAALCDSDLALWRRISAVNSFASIANLCGPAGRASLEGHNKEKAVSYPLYRLLLDEPNPEMTSFVFRETGPVCKLLTVCLCGCCPGRLVSFVFDGGFAAEAGVDAAGVVEVFEPGGDPGVDL